MTPPFLPRLRELFQDAGGRPLAQAASVSPAGRPEVRTVVLRGLGAEGDAWFASDARSGKVVALAATPYLELCLWWPARGVQWRLSGRTSTHLDDDLAEATWLALPADTRELFASPAPGPPRPGPLAAATSGPPTDAAGDRPPTTFMTIRLVPDRCERLTLGSPLKRVLWTLADERWRETELVP